MIILQPSGWPRPKGYSNGIEAQGRQIFTAGVIGWNAREEFETDDFAGQARQCFENIKAILAEAGAEPKDLVRLTWYITDKKAYLDSLEGVGTAYREVFGKVFPTMAVVQVAGLLEDRAQIEIEATAVVSESDA